MISSYLNLKTVNNILYQGLKVHMKLIEKSYIKCRLTVSSQIMYFSCSFKIYIMIINLYIALYE